MSPSDADDKSSHTSNTSFLDRISLTVKIVVLTVLIGISLWALMDYIQSSKLKKIFYVQLLEELSEQSMEDRLFIDRYIRSHYELAELFVTQRNFGDYIKKQNWSAEDKTKIKYYNRTPPWFLGSSILRILARPRYSMLFDTWGRVREVYSNRNDTPPPALLQPTELMLLKSRDQSFITEFDGRPYLITSEIYTDNLDILKASLILASPIDEDFLVASIGTLIPKHLVALVTLGKEPRILISSNNEKLPAGTLLQDLRDRFIVTGQHTYDYGSAEYIIKLVSFISMAEVDRLTRSVISTGRQQRNIIAPVFIFIFTLIMVLVTRRISRLNRRMSDFSQQTLGTKKQTSQRGDQLYILEKRFHRLTEEVIEARDMLKKQEEEKTSLIINNAFDAIITMDADSVITTWNPQAEVIFGWERKQAVGKTVTDIIIPKHFKIIQGGIRDFLTAGVSSIFNKQIQITAIHHEGHKFPAELSISPAQSEGKYFFVVIIRDISERKLSEDQIRSSLKEKEVLLKEIHHRVKNNMQVISSLLNLQSRHFEDSKYAELFNESKNRINSMALVHHKLYQSKDLANIDFEDYIKSLSENLFMFYGISPHLVTLKVDVKDIILSIDTAIPCGLIINELISNCLKYAFPDSRKGDILISLNKTSAGGKSGSDYKLILKDNGIGIPDNLDVRNTESLGLQLVTTLIEHQLQGRFELNRVNGTEFQIFFKELVYKKRTGN